MPSAPAALTDCQEQRGSRRRRTVRAGL